MKNKFNAIFLFFAFSLIGCDLKLEKYTFYENEDRYELIENNGMNYADNIKNINLDWVNGNVKIIKSNTHEGISINETIKGNSKDEFFGRTCIENETLIIKYCKSNISIPTNIRKYLTISINSEIQLDTITINNVSSSLEINELKCNILDINNISGSVNISKVNTPTINFNGISGSFVAILSQITNSITINQVSASSIVSLPSTTGGFKISFSSISGSCSYDDFTEATKFEDEIIYKDRSYLSINVSTTSGKLSVSRYNSDENIIERNE